jgi:hypothetical protein
MHSNMNVKILLFIQAPAYSITKQLTKSLIHAKTVLLAKKTNQQLRNSDKYWKHYVKDYTGFSLYNAAEVQRSRRTSTGPFDFTNIFVAS